MLWGVRTTRSPQLMPTAPAVSEPTTSAAASAIAAEVSSAAASRCPSSLAIAPPSPHSDACACSEPGGSASCYWNRYGSSVTTRLKDAPGSPAGPPVGTAPPWSRRPDTPVI